MSLRHVSTVLAVLALGASVACSGTPGASPSATSGSAPAAAQASSAAAQPSSVAPSGSPAAATGTPLTLHAIIQQTGGGAFLGKEAAESLKVLQTVTNQKGGVQGHPVQFVTQDDQSQPSVDIQILNQWKAQNVQVVLGPSIVADCNALVPLISNGPVDYCFSPGIHPPKGSFAFTGSVSTDVLILETFKYALSQHWTNIATLTSSDATGQDADNGIASVLKRPEFSGIKLVAKEHFNLTDVSVNAQMARIKAASPQMLIAWTTGPSFGTVLKSIQQEGLTIPIATTSGNQTLAQMQQYKAFLPKDLLIACGVWAAYPDNVPAGPQKDAMKTFFDAFQAAGIKPDVGQILAWDPANIVLDAYRHLGVNATAPQIRDYIANLKNYAGVIGTYDFTKTPQRGLSEDQVVMSRWDPTKNFWVAVTKPPVQ